MHSEFDICTLPPAVFYVAMTRATHRWTVIAPDSGESPLLAQI